MYYACTSEAEFKAFNSREMYFFFFLNVVNVINKNQREEKAQSWCDYNIRSVKVKFPILDCQRCK